MTTSAVNHDTTVAAASVAAFKTAFGTDPEGTWCAPGRVNLIGEHTDYNDGFVLPLALPQRVTVAARRREDGVLRLRSLQEDGEVEVAPGDGPGDVAGWAAYVAGVAWALREKGVDVPGADLVVDGEVPLGAGLSSSAALECAVGLALLDLAGAALSPTELALAAQHAENDYVGTPCGVMDQMASVHGQRGHVLFLDTRSLEVEPVPFDLERRGLALLVVDTRAPHRLVDGEYAERRATCHAAAKALGVPALRDVALSDLPSELDRLDSDVARRRVRHVVTEDARVLEVVDHLRRGEDPRVVGPLLTASHASLRDDYEVTVPELDTAVDAALAAGAHGARMTGGGFGGSVIALVEAADVDAVSDAVAAAFDEAGFAPPRTFVAVPAEGAHRVG
ncbi:MAG: galactokinase [Motilibacteraceae bacterium]